MSHEQIRTALHTSNGVTHMNESCPTLHTGNRVRLQRSRYTWFAADIGSPDCDVNPCTELLCMCVCVSVFVCVSVWICGCVYCDDNPCTDNVLNQIHSHTHAQTHTHTRIHTHTRTHTHTHTHTLILIVQSAARAHNVLRELCVRLMRAHTHTHTL